MLLCRQVKSCPLCRKLLTTANGYRDHMRNHEGVFRYCCKYCHRGFNATKNYLEHLASHTGVSYFRCRGCNVCFRSRYLLQRHINSDHAPCGDSMIQLANVGDALKQLWVVPEDQQQQQTSVDSSEPEMATESSEQHQNYS